MVPDFVIPAFGQSVRDLELNRDNRVSVRSVTKLDATPEPEQRALLNSLTEALHNPVSAFECLSGQNQDQFDLVYSFVRYFDQGGLGNALKGQFIDLLCTSFTRLLKSIQVATDSASSQLAVERNAFKASLYFLATITRVAEKQLVEQKTLDDSNKLMNKGRKKTAPKAQNASTPFPWAAHRCRVLQCMLSSLFSVSSKGTVEWLDLGRLWQCGLPEESVINLYWTVAETLLESKGNFSDTETKRVLLHMIAAPANRFHSTVSHSIVSALGHGIRKHEHFADVVVQLIQVIVTPVEKGGYGDDRLPRELILDIGRLDVDEASRDTSGIRNLGAFIEALGSNQPKLLLANLSVLLPHLGSEAYKIRCSIVLTLGSLVAYLRKAPVYVHDSPSEGDNPAADDHKDANASKETRDQLLDILSERTQDINSYVRASSLKAYTMLCQCGSVPLSHLHIVTDIATNRLFDKSSTVRKHAIALLTALLENNPYNSQLQPAFYAAEVQQVQEWLQANDIKVKQEPTDDGEEEDPEERTDPSLESDEEEDEQVEAEKRAKLKLLEYCKSALMFIAKLENASSEICDLLSSKSTSDVQEALRFLTKAHAFQLPGAERGIRRLLALVWDKRESGAVKKELLETIEELYILAAPLDKDSSTTTRRVGKRRLLAPHVIANNLINLILGATLSERTSLERVVVESMQSDGCLKRKILPAQVIDSLWDVIAASPSPSSSEDARERKRAALCLISMAANDIPKVVDRPERVELLVDLCRQPLPLDYEVARYALMALHNCVLANQKYEGYILQQKAEAHRIKSLKYMASVSLETIVSVVTRLICDVHDDSFADDFLANQWYPAAENGINLLFVLAQRPDNLCENMIVEMLHKVFGPSSGSTTSVSTHYLSRVFFVASHVAVKMLVFTDEVASLAKRCRADLCEKHHDAKDRKARASAKDDEPSSKSGKKDNEEEDDLEMVDPGADDMEELLQRHISERELVSTLDNLLGMVSPLLLRVVANDEQRFFAHVDVGPEDPRSSAERQLRESAVLSFCKFMSVSSEYCEKHLQFLFTLLQNIEDPAIRGNIMIALGDLAFRFPNTVEPYTAQIYRRLRDPDTVVRKNTLMVLTHLILNDMVKVRGEISEISICLEDEDSRVRDLAGLFFTELSKKGTNPVYNLLPDALGRLSRDEQVSEASFKSISKYMISFIKLDRHCESIVDKLCQRIFAASGASGENDEVDVSTMEGMDQCRDFAFCLEQIKWSEKMIRKLSDQQFKLIRPVLADETVYNSFMRIVNKGRSFSKPETKQALSELETKLQEAHEKQASDERTKVAAARTKTKSRTQRSTGNRRRQAVKKEESSDSEQESDSWDSQHEEEDEDDDSINAENALESKKSLSGPQKSRTSRRPRRSVLGEVN